MFIKKIYLMFIYLKNIQYIPKNIPKPLYIFMSKGTINLRLRTFIQLEKTNSDFRSVPEVMSSDFFFWPLFCLFFFASLQEVLSAD